MRRQKSYLSDQYHQYSQKAIRNKIYPEYVGISRDFSKIKKNRIKTEQTRDQYGHEVSSLTKINERLEKNLKKKEKQINYVQKVRNRYISEMIQKQKIKEDKQIELQRLRHKTIEDKLIGERKRRQSINQFRLQKKHEKITVKSLLESERQRRLQNEEKQYIINNSRVKQIESEKKQTIDKYHSFYRNRNKQQLQNYVIMMHKEKETESKAIKDTKKLQKKLVLLKEKIRQKEEALQQMEESLSSVRNSGRMSRISSGSIKSITPYQILTSDSGPNLSKIRLKKK